MIHNFHEKYFVNGSRSIVPGLQSLRITLYGFAIIHKSNPVNSHGGRCNQHFAKRSLCESDPYHYDFTLRFKLTGTECIQNHKIIMEARETGESRIQSRIQNRFG